MGLWNNWRMLRQMVPLHTGRNLVFFFTSDEAGVAADAVVSINNDSIFAHDDLLRLSFQYGRDFRSSSDNRTTDRDCRGS